MGPLQGLKVIEMAGLGPGPYCGMLLGDLGADVVRIDRPSSNAGVMGDPTLDVMQRNKRSLVVDLKQKDGVELVLELAGSADVLFEGFRPGVMERLGLGPDLCLARNKKLVYGRMTGFGQTGPYAKAAGHDINYLALSGALGSIGTREQPVVPLNLVADFGGGAMFLALGILSALWHAQRTGQGQVVDATMIDGAASMTSIFYSFLAMGLWKQERASNLLDGGAGQYNVYQTQDGKWVSVGALEPQFYAKLCELLGLEQAALGNFMDPADWPAQRQKLAAVFKTKTREEWDALLGGTDACYAPIMTFADAHLHPHNVARGVFAEVNGIKQVSPAPRFSATPGELRTPPARNGAHSLEVLREWGIAGEKVDALVEAKVVGT